MKYPQIQNRRGFSAIEIMIALSMIGVSSIALMDMMRGFSQNQGESDRRTQIQDMITDVKNSLSTEADCLANLKDVGGTSMSVDPSTAATHAVTDPGQKISILLKNSNNSLLQEGVINSYFPKIMATKIRLKDFTLVTGTTSTYTARITVDPAPASSKNKTLDQYAERTITSLFLTVDSANKLHSCYAAAGGTDMQALCNSIGGSWDPTAAKCSLSAQTQCENWGGTWANNACTSDPKTECLTQLNGTWNGSQCLENVNPVTLCTDMGGSWVNGACATNTAECSALGASWDSSSNSCLVPVDPNATCAALGGSYSGGSCNVIKTCSPNSQNGATTGSYTTMTHSGTSQIGFTTTYTTYSCINGTWVQTGKSSSTTEGSGSA